MATTPILKYIWNPVVFSEMFRFYKLCHLVNPMEFAPIYFMLWFALVILSVFVDLYKVYTHIPKQEFHWY